MMKNVVYRDHHSGKDPEARLRYRELNSGSDHPSFNSRGSNPVPAYAVQNKRDRIITNIHKASQSAPPEDVMQPGRGLSDLMGRRG
jgi:hypothetical protein